jgi:hypothetical protein
MGLCSSTEEPRDYRRSSERKSNYSYTNARGRKAQAAPPPKPANVEDRRRTSEFAGKTRKPKAFREERPKTPRKKKPAPLAFYE